jgi:hypothetical protein
MLLEWWDGYVARMREIIVLNIDVKKNLELPGIWQQNINIFLKEIGVEHVKFIGTAENRAVLNGHKSTN